MKRIIKIGIPIGMLLLLLIGIAKLGLLPRGTLLDRFAPESAFVRDWRAQLEAAKTPESAASVFRTNKEGGEVVQLDDGEWVAVVMEHECCTGAGFNATLYVTSNGESYLDSDTCYCGYFPLGDELIAHNKKSLDSFLASIRSRGKQLTKL